MIKTYIETTIPSFYHNNRNDPEAIAMERWTKKWWDHQSSEYHVVSSIAVINELRQGDHPRKDQKIQFMSDIHLLPLVQEVRDIVRIYINRKMMPSNPIDLPSLNHSWVYVTGLGQ